VHTLKHNELNHYQNQQTCAQNHCETRHLTLTYNYVKTTNKTLQSSEAEVHKELLTKQQIIEQIVVLEIRKTMLARCRYQRTQSRLYFKQRTLLHAHTHTHMPYLYGWLTSITIHRTAYLWIVFGRPGLTSSKGSKLYQLKPESPARGLWSSPPACTASLIVGSSRAPWYWPWPWIGSRSYQHTQYV